MVRAGSRSADVSEFQDVGPEDEKALGPNVTSCPGYIQFIVASNKIVQ